MSLSIMERARVLNEALPYIQEFSGKIVVVKYGGNAMISENLRRAVLSDIVLLHQMGIRVVVVHGGGPEINDMLKKIGKEGRFVNGLRYTDPETMEIVQQVLCGKVSKDLVSLIHAYGGRAMGLCGMDGRIIEAVKKTGDGFDYGLVGEITAIHDGPVRDVLEAGYIPVISTVAAGADGEKCYNINADYVAAEMAGALKAEKLLLLTDVEGIYKDFNDKSSFISTLHMEEARAYIKEGIIAGGMIPKVEACLKSLAMGTGKTHIIDGRLGHSPILEMFTAKGIGTQVVR